MCEGATQRHGYCTQLGLNNLICHDKMLFEVSHHQEWLLILYILYRLCLQMEMLHVCI